MNDPDKTMLDDDLRETAEWAAEILGGTDSVVAPTFDELNSIWEQDSPPDIAESLIDDKLDYLARHPGNNAALRDARAAKARLEGSDLGTKTRPTQAGDSLLAQILETHAAENSRIWEIAAASERSRVTGSLRTVSEENIYE